MKTLLLACLLLIAGSAGAQTVYYGGGGSGVSSWPPVGTPSDFTDNVDNTGASGAVLDLADDGADESASVAEIATSASNAIFSEPSANKLYIDLGQPWPTCSALAANPTDCGASEGATAIAANGNLTCDANVIFAADIDTDTELATLLGVGDYTGTLNSEFVLADQPVINNLIVTGTGVFPTQSANDDSTAPATTSFVQGEINGAGGAGLTASSGVLAVSSSESGFLTTGASPTTATVSELEFDTDAWGANRGALTQIDGTAQVIYLAALASDSPSNGQVATWNTGGTITWENAGSGTGDIATVGDCINGDAFTGSCGTTLASNTDIIIDLDEDNNGTESFQVRDGANTVVAELSEAGTLQLDGVLNIDGAGTSDFDGTVSAPSIEVDRSTTPTLEFKDSDATDTDVNARVYANCTDGATTTEDCDVTIAHQIAGTERNILVAVAGGGITIGAAQHTSVTITTDGTGDGTDLVLPTGSVGSSEIGSDLSAADLADSLDLGGDTSFEIPNGTGNTVDTTGEIAMDTSAGQLVASSNGATLSIFHPVLQECAVVENLAAADDSFEFWMTPHAVTVTSVGCRCRGTCTGTATLTLEDRGGNAMTITGTNPTCATTGNATYAAVTAGNGLVAGEGIAFDVTNTPNPETDEYTICVTYTVDRQ